MKDSDSKMVILEKYQNKFHKMTTNVLFGWPGKLERVGNHLYVSFDLKIISSLQLFLVRRQHHKTNNQLMIIWAYRFLNSNHQLKLPIVLSYYKSST